MKHHPDRGGDTRTMQDINGEYDLLFSILKGRENIANAETGPSSRRKFYTEEGWEGEKYDKNLQVKDIAALVRQYVKRAFPNCKFSICSDYKEISISLMQADFNPLANFDDMEKMANDYIEWGRDFEGKNILEHVKYLKKNGHTRINHHSIKESRDLSSYGRAFFQQIVDFVQGYNFDDSDSMQDYFHCNFYLNINIGKWNKPFIQRGDMQYSTSAECRTKTR